LAMSIPAALKMRHGTLKYLLKKAVRGVIADDLIDRPKQGFDVPLYEWFAEKFGAQASKELLQFCRLTEFLDHTAVERLLHQSKGRQIWYLLNFALWWKTFIAV
jgi:asparagine synthase (glutamine-hydrolysing)